MPRNHDQCRGPDKGKIVALPPVGGLHHRYERLVFRLLRTTEA